MLKYLLALVIALLMISCKGMYRGGDELEALVTPRECKRACYPGVMKEIVATEGVCRCYHNRRLKKRSFND